MERKIILSIAATDPSCGAGVQADLKTIAAHGHYGISAITGVTVQNSDGIVGIQVADEVVFRDEMFALMKDFRPDAVKIGLLPSQKIVRAVAEAIEVFDFKNVVIDPVLASSRGRFSISEDNYIKRSKLLYNNADVLTPNLAEAEVLLGRHIVSYEDKLQAAESLSKKMGCSIILKGGHLTADECEHRDIVVMFNKEDEKNETVIISNNQSADSERDFHGTGCAYSSALACRLAEGKNLSRAASLAKLYIIKAMHEGEKLSDELGMEEGFGLLDHFVEN